MIFGLQRDGSGAVSNLFRSTYGLEPDAETPVLLPPGYVECTEQEYEQARAAFWNTLQIQAQRLMPVWQAKAAVLVAMGETFTPEQRAYVQALQAIAAGTDTTSTALPAEPAS